LQPPPIATPEAHDAVIGVLFWVVIAVTVDMPTDNFVFTVKLSVTMKPTVRPAPLARFRFWALSVRAVRSAAVLNAAAVIEPAALSPDVPVSTAELDVMAPTADKELAVI